MTSVCVAGSTGLVGSQILSALLTRPQFNKVYAFTRRDLQTDTKLNELKSTDTSTWPAAYPKDATIFYSGIGTTRAQAGSVAKQRETDVDLNVELAKAAKAAGTKVYVLISSNGANSSSFMPYPQMKGEIEDAVIKLGFDHCIILRPGLLLGNRADSRLAESALQYIARGMGTIHHGLSDFWAGSGETVGRAAVAASQAVLDGSEKRPVWILSHAEIMRLGKTEA